ncbi:hypothetical protein [Ferrimonas futtsuensis]|uniref:hypothetical protein n=1 Tax=Ferrimonas futtsuensis TaxID=364764 RepID=UPI0004825834|nr:hypothetical protein [Ferrimonas futtsuensis]
MKFVSALLLIFSLNSFGNQILTSKEVYDAEAPIYWQIQKTVTINETITVPLLFEFSQRGNGSVKIKHGLWIRIYDCHNNSYIFEPCLMEQELLDINSDGFNDVLFESQLIYTGEKESDPKIDKGKVFVQLIYSPSEKTFILGKHSESIKPYEYYEE